jgi:hypothetical protein
MPAASAEAFYSSLKPECPLYFLFAQNARRVPWKKRYGDANPVCHSPEDRGRAQHPPETRDDYRKTSLPVSDIRGWD